MTNKSANEVPKCTSSTILVQARISSSVFCRTKSGLSSLLMKEAWRLAGLCDEIESSEKHLPWPQRHSQENLGHAAASVIMAAAAVEAVINEIFLQAVDASTTAFPNLNQTQVGLLAACWDIVESSRASAINKHRVALAAVGRPEISRGTEPGQSAESLFQLRNLLVHFVPEWDDKLDKHQKIEKRLLSKFPPNQLSANAQGHMLWFPGKCLGAGCAKWACESAVNYHKEFAIRLGIEARIS